MAKSSLPGVILINCLRSRGLYLYHTLLRFALEEIKKIKNKVEAPSSDVTIWVLVVVCFVLCLISISLSAVCCLLHWGWIVQGKYTELIFSFRLLNKLDNSSQKDR